MHSHTHAATHTLMECWIGFCFTHLFVKFHCNWICNVFLIRTLSRKNDIIVFLVCLSVCMFVTVFVFTVSDTLSYNIYSLHIGACDKYSITYVEKKKTWMPLKWTESTMHICVCTHLLRFDQTAPKHSNSTEVSNYIRFHFFSIVAMYCTCFVCHLNFYGFFFHFDTFVCIRLHWLHT